MGSSRRPWFKFFHRDWRGDAALRLCSASTRGFWIEVIAALEEADDGAAVTGTVEQLARLTGCTAAEVEAAIGELETHDVAPVERDMSVTGHTLFTVTSRRMSRLSHERVSARNRKRRERQRAKCHGGVTPPVTGQKSEVRSQRSEEEKKEPPVSPPYRPDVTPSRRPASPATHAPYSSPFMAFWEAYPRKVAKGEAWKAWLVLRPAPGLQAEMLRAIAAQMRSPRWRGGTIPNPATWLRARRWEDDPASLTAIGERRNGGGHQRDDRPNPYRPTREQLDALPPDHPDRRYWDDEIH